MERKNDVLILYIDTKDVSETEKGLGRESVLENGGKRRGR